MPRRHVPQQKEKSFPVWIFAGAFLLILAAVIFWSVQSGETGEGKLGPRLSLNTERIDLGKQPFDKVVRAEFMVTNTGDRSLTLDASPPIRVVEGC
jgi:hypothetical protein